MAVQKMLDVIGCERDDAGCDRVRRWTLRNEALCHSYTDVLYYRIFGLRGSAAPMQYGEI